MINFSLVSATYESFINVVGVDNHGQGIIGNVTVEVQPGKGRVLVDTTPLQGIYTQDSERIAVEVASEITGFDFSQYDVIYSIVTSNVHVIDGPSAGGALTLATIAAVEGKEISHDFAMTGTIEEDGSIGEVGEILTKAKAAADGGITVFLIPEGQSIQNQYVKKIKQPQPGWYIESIEPIEVNVIEYAKDNWGMDIYEVSDIKEVMEYAFGEIPESNEKNIGLVENVILPKFESPINNYNDFSLIVKDDLKVAESKYNDILNKVDNSNLPEDIKLVLNDLMVLSEDYLKNAKEIEGQGYAYSSANEAFKSAITSNVVDDLINYYSSDNQIKYLEESVEEIESNIKQAKQEVSIKTDKIICDPDNFEWAVAARHRITYAENRVKSINLDEDTPIEVFYKINTAKEWIKISKSFLEKPVYHSAGTDCLELFKEQAESLVKEAENQILLEKSMGYEGIEDSEWYLEAAKSELEQGWYITAIYDAISAKIRVKVGSSYDNKDMNEIYSDFNEQEIITQDLIGTIFLENSYYNIYRAAKDESRVDGVLAIQTLVLAEETNDVYQDIKNKMGNPLFKWSIDWNFKFIKENYDTLVKIFFAVLVLCILILSVKVKRLKRKLGIRRNRKELR